MWGRIPASGSELSSIGSLWLHWLRGINYPTGSEFTVRNHKVQVKQEMLDKIILDRIIQRIVKTASPEKIILFGSAARGEMGSNSDIDLLVVKSGVHRRRLAQEIYRNLLGIGYAVDVIVATPEDLERYKDSFALVIEPALREGKVMYAS